MRYLLLIAALLLASPAQAQGVVDGYSAWRAAAGGGGDPDFVDTGTLLDLTALTATGTSEDVDMPDSLQSGDFLVVVAAYKTSISTPAGWTEHSTSGCYNSPWGFGLFVASHTVTTPGSEPSALTISGLPASQPFKAIILRFSDSSSVDDVSCLNNGATQVTSHVTNDATPTNSPGLTVTAVGTRYAATHTFTGSPSTNIIASGATGGNNFGLAISYAESSGTSAQGSGTFTNNLARPDTMFTLAIH
jgi:hypothetical protein